ncbi:putative ATP synthase subunit d, mitochondrial-like [Capsicum annuum]|nr:putative ATP synthase subunit d, mitochondrial-like [Capsicum annuum]
MSEVNDYVVGDTGIRYNSSYSTDAAGGDGGSYGGETPAAKAAENWKYHAVEFAKGFAEMSVEFGKGVRDVLKQSVIKEDSILVKKIGPPFVKVCGRFSFLNEYLPEDRDPAYAWSVIFFVLFLASAVLIASNDNIYPTPSVKKVCIHPPNASRILLPDGRHLAYHEQGVPAELARFSMIAPHSFLSSRLAGIPGIKTSLLQEYGIRLVTYDLPGFGESDPHPSRNLESSAMDMLHLSYAVNVTDKFWVVGYSGGCMHAWAALRYIPDRIAGAVMVAPMVNPYEPRMTKVEKNKMWKTWTTKKKAMYILARKFPRLLPYFYHRSFLSRVHGPIETRLALSLGIRDKALLEHPSFEDFWQRDLEEAVRQKNAKPFVEEAVLQVSNWGFSPADLKVQRKRPGKGIVHWIKSLYGQTEEILAGFLGQIHIWQGMEDMVVPPSTTDFLQRVLPDAMVHRLLYEGHFTYFYFCDECHRRIFSTLFGNPQGPVVPEPEADQSPIQNNDGETPDTILGDTTTEEENVSCVVNSDKEEEDYID